MTALDNAAESGCETCQRLLLACSTRKQHRPRSSANVCIIVLNFKGLKKFVSIYLIFYLQFAVMTSWWSRTVS